MKKTNLSCRISLLRAISKNIKEVLNMSRKMMRKTRASSLHHHLIALTTMDIPITKMMMKRLLFKKKKINSNLKINASQAILDKSGVTCVEVHLLWRKKKVSLTHSLSIIEP
jgi:hypothetical protein